MYMSTRVPRRHIGRHFSEQCRMAVLRNSRESGKSGVSPVLTAGYRDAPAVNDQVRISGSRTAYGRDIYPTPHLAQRSDGPRPPGETSSLVRLEYRERVCQLDPIGCFSPVNDGDDVQSELSGRTRASRSRNLRYSRPTS